MPLSDLQKFLENHIPGACLPVDLLKIAKSVGYRRQNRGGNKGSYNNVASPLTIVVDGECCLDRLYGGFFSDWVCGGQWNRTVQFLAVLIQTVQNNNIELAVFFNGALEQQRIGEWAHSQSARRKHINSVLRHVSMKGTPPPKVWWLSPTGLRMCLRMALRHLGIQVVCSMDDHHQEVIAFCRENNYHGLMAEDAEYIIFDPPRYFSSHQLKLTYKGSLETKEFILEEVEKGLNLSRNFFCFLATLLGNYLLTEIDLSDFYSTIIPGYNKDQNSQEDVIRAVSTFITNSCDVNNLMTVGAQIFGSVSDPRVAKFKESVQYFLNGTKDGFLQYKPFLPGRRDIGMPIAQCRHEFPFMNSLNMREKHVWSLSESRTLRRPSVPSVQEENISETTLNSINLQVSNQNRFHKVFKQEYSEEKDKVEPAVVPQIIIEMMGPHSPKVESHSGSHSPDPTQLEQALESCLGEFTIVITNEAGDNTSDTDFEIERNYDSDSRRGENGEITLDVKQTEQGDVDHDSGGGCLGSTASGSPGASLLLSSSSSSSNSSAASPYRLTPDVSWAAQNNRTKNDSAKIQNRNGKICNDVPDDFHPLVNSIPNLLPPVPHEVTRTASERHQKGLMCPWIYQVINQGEVKFEPCLQDDNCSEFPNAIIFFRPIRQYIYAILFNLHHHTFMARKAKEEGQNLGSVPEIKVREWVYSKENPYRTWQLVEAFPINWSVPTVQRLWFGSVIDDKKRRLRAFLSCLHSDTQLMLHTAYVPQHLLIMATVLRFILSRNEYPILRKQEFDAFLVTAFSSELTDAQYLQDLQIPMLNPRGIQLASFFMVGVEMALFANDACGSPIPWLVCCPWLFFDGKLFHSILLKANWSRSLLEVCEGNTDLARKVERCRKAILEGLNVKFLQCQETGIKVPIHPPPHYAGPPTPYAYADHSLRGKGKGVRDRNGGRRLYSRGGQLQVAGIVVGQWGPNFGTINSRTSQNQSIPPPGRGRYCSSMRMPKPSIRGRPSVLVKRRMIKRKEVRPLKGRLQPTILNQSLDFESPEDGRMLPILNPSMKGESFVPFSYEDDICDEENLYTADQENSNLTPFHSCNNNNNGLKSPDSGVNVSILE